MKKIDYIITFSGIRINPTKLIDKKDIHLDDIAHSLSLQCRFGGHTRTHYSVADHSILVSELAEAENPKAALAGLLHDAAETYILDFPTPLKQQDFMADYRRTENKILKVIFEKYNVTHTKEIMDIVKKADNLALAIEIKELMPKHEGFDYLNLDSVKDLKLVINPSERAERLFKERFSRLIKSER